MPTTSSGQALICTNCSALDTSADGLDRGSGCFNRLCNSSSGGLFICIHSCVEKFKYLSAKCSSRPDLGLTHPFSSVTGRLTRIWLRVSVNGLHKDLAFLIVGRCRQRSISASQMLLICSSCAQPSTPNTGINTSQRSSNH